MSRDKQIDIDIAVEEMASAVRERTVACHKCEYYKEGSCLKPIDLGCNDNEDILNLCDAIYEKGYRKSTDLAEEIFGEIEFEIHQLDFDREETRAIAIEGIIAKAKKKYTEEGK